jgi:hypothetical protein
MRLSTFAAQPRRVVLGGIPMMVAKLRLRDLAFLETWMAAVVPRPAPGDDIPGGWPPTFDTQAGLALISSGEGVARLLFASLRQTIPGLKIEQAREITSSIDVEEFAPFYAAVFPENDHATDRDENDNRRSNWHARINHIALTYHYTPDQILDMPLDQFFALGCEPENPGPETNWEVPIHSPKDLDRLWAERQARKRADGE